MTEKDGTIPHGNDGQSPDETTTILRGVVGELVGLFDASASGR